MKKLVAILLAAVLVLGAFSACKPAATTTTEPAAPAAPAAPADPAAPAAPADTTTTEPVATAAEKVYRTYLSSDCPILNGHDSVEGSLQTPHNYCSAFLFRAVPTADGTNFEYIGDIASELPIQIDEYNWQIKIRPEACWQNGDPINADTFMYSYKMQLDPILANQMADFIADYSVTIVNAIEYARQGTSNTVAWEDVGIKKIDDYTIQITTVDANTQVDVCKQFTDRSCAPVYEPYYEAGMNADRTDTTYGTTLETWMGCGPYFFDTWEFDSIHVYKKNPNYWLSDRFNYDTVEVRIIPEMNARVELWEQGKLDDFTPDANTIETYIDDPRTREYTSFSVYHVDVNCQNPNNPISGTIAYRKALYHALDRETLARDIFGYMMPAGTYVNGLAGVLHSGAEGISYRESEQGKAVTAMVESWGPAGYNPEMAREYLAQAYAEAGVPEDTVIPVILAFDESDKEWKAAAEFLLEQFPVIFEGKIDLQVVTYAGMSATAWKATGPDKWDLSPNDWTRGVSATYPYTCFYYYLSTYGSHPNNFFSEAFEAQYAVCDASEIKTDYQKMLDETKKLEEIYLEQVIHLPICQVVGYQMFSDRLEIPVTTYLPNFGWGSMYGDIVG